MVRNVYKNCALCDIAIQRELSIQQMLAFKPIEFDLLCNACRQHFTFIYESDSQCQGCGRLLEKDSQNEYKRIYTYPSLNGSVYCKDCYRWLSHYPVNYLNHRAIFKYNNSVREWLYRYKYRGDYRLRSVVREELVQIYQRYKTYRWLILPSSSKSLEQRGFHAVGSLLDLANIPYETPFIYQGDGHRQASKSREERLKLKQPFALAKDFIGSFQTTSPYLIFDDVYTTGATILAAKHLILSQTRQKQDNVIELLSLSLARDQLE